MASKRVSVHRIADCRTFVGKDGKPEVHQVGFVMIRATRDAHGHIVEIENMGEYTRG